MKYKPTNRALRRKLALREVQISTLLDALEKFVKPKEPRVTFELTEAESSKAHLDALRILDRYNRFGMRYNGYNRVYGSWPRDKHNPIFWK